MGSECSRRFWKTERQIFWRLWLTVKLDSFSEIRMEWRRWFCIGNIDSNMQSIDTIVFSKCRCQRLCHTFADILTAITKRRLEWISIWWGIWIWGLRWIITSIWNLTMRRMGWFVWRELEKERKEVDKTEGKMPMKQNMFKGMEALWDLNNPWGVIFVFGNCRMKKKIV